MSQNLPPQMEGQESSPNPIELFWEKNRRTILFVLGLFAVVIAGLYAMQYMNRAKADRLSSTLMVAANLDRAYAEPESLGMNNNSKMMLQFIAQNMVFGLDSDLEDASDAELEKAIGELDGDKRQACMLWAAGNAYFLKGMNAEGETRSAYFDKATATLERLKSDFPKSEYVARSDAPVQVLERKEADPDAPSTDDPEFEDPVPGSPVERALARVAEQQSFLANNQARFFEPVRPPEGSPVVTFTFDGYGDVSFELYRNAAPEHVDALLQLVHEDWFDKQRIYELRRNQAAFRDRNSQAETLKFGLPSSREDDRTKWETTEPTPEDAQLDFNVNEAARALSHFEGTLSAIREGEKFSTQRYQILATDGSGQLDGEAPVIGLVKDEASMDVIRAMIDAPLSNDQEESAGTGKPATNIEITEVVVTERGGWEPKAPDEEKAPEDDPKENGDPKEGEGGNGK